MISHEDLEDLSMEIVSVVEGSFGIGLEYDDIVGIVKEILVEKIGDPKITHSAWLDGRMSFV